MKYMFLFIFFFGLAGVLEAASPAKDIKQGNSLFNKKEYDKALKRYQQALTKKQESDIVNFDAGTGFYKTGDYENAVGHLQKALLSDDPKLRQAAYYNLGNAFFKSGMSRENADLNQAVSSLKQALSGYDNALKFNDKDQDARYNQEIAKKELERLKQKQQQRQNQQKQNNQQTSQEAPQPSPSGEQGKENQPNQAQQEQSQGQKPEEQKEQPSPTSGEQQDQAGEENKEQPDHGQRGQSGQENPSQESLPGDKQNPSPASSGENMNKQEADMLLDEYERDEETQGLLNIMKFQRNDKPVRKDW